MSPGGAGGGAASGNLADLVVQYIVKGQDELRKSLEDMQMAVGAVVLAVQKMSREMQDGLNKSKEEVLTVQKVTVDLGEKFKAVGTAINVALGAGVGIIANFVRQGLAAGAMGQAFGYTMERLSLTISGLFRPELMKVIDLVNKLTSWLQSLSESQKRMIAHFVEGAAAALAVGVILPKIVSGIYSIVVAVQALSAAIAGAEVMTGIGAILPIIGLAVEGMALLVVGTETGRTALSEMWQSVKELVGALADLARALQIPDLFQAISDAATLAARGISVIAEKVRELIAVLKELADSKFGRILAGIAASIAGPINSMFGELHARAEELRNKNGENRGPDMHRAGGFEDLKRTYERIAVASLHASAGARSPEERTAKATEETNAAVQFIRGLMMGLKIQPFAP